MKIKMLTLMASPSGVVKPGASIDIDKAEAVRLIAGGFAEPLEPLEPEKEEKPDDGLESDKPVKRVAKSGGRKKASKTPAK
ncbi:MAG: hypothetical protein IJH75_01665 [Mogibacterium sp.]|nr:hypothetical protein [Mogibacterium sp.]